MGVITGEYGMPSVCIFACSLFASISVLCVWGCLLSVFASVDLNVCLSVHILELEPEFQLYSH